MSLARRASAELGGTGLLVAAVIGSGIAAARLSPHDTGLQLLENAVATALALGALIITFGPVSGAHFNPIVSAVDWWPGRPGRHRPHRTRAGGLRHRANIGRGATRTPCNSIS